MVEINLHQPGLLNVILPFPEEWNELQLQELHSISRHMLGEFEIPSAMRGAILRDLITCRWKQSGQDIPKDWFNKLDAENIVIDAYPLLDFLYKENCLTVQPYPSLQLNWHTKLSGPESEFDNITCGEFEDTEIFFFEFMHNPGPEPLAHMASILWRKKGVPYIRHDFKKGKYISYDAEKLYQQFLKLPAHILYTIFIWYSGCSNLLRKIFRNSFEKGSDKGEPDIIAFTKCIHAGAGQKNGSRDQIRMMLLKEFFLDMELEGQKVKESTNAT